MERTESHRSLGGTSSVISGVWHKMPLEPPTLSPLLRFFRSSLPVAFYSKQVNVIILPRKMQWARRGFLCVICLIFPASVLLFCAMEMHKTVHLIRGLPLLLALELYFLVISSAFCYRLTNHMTEPLDSYGEYLHG